MEKVVTIRLNDVDWGQILDGLEERRIAWQATAEYLEIGYTDRTDFVEECSDADEAQAIADDYQRIIDSIRTQRKDSA